MRVPDTPVALAKARRFVVLLVLALVVLAVAAYWHDRWSGGGGGRNVTGVFRGIPYTLYEPVGHSGEALPLVLALHGCSGSPRRFARSTRWNPLADREGFLVLYPQEIASHHEDLCWRWFSPSDQERGKGEPALFVGLIDHVAKQARVDRSRVYAVGLSSGGAMSTILGACYPDVFAAVGVHSGEEFIRGMSRDEAKSVPGHGGPDPDRQGTAAHACAGDAAHPIPVLVLHGDDDTLARPINGEQVFRQFAQTNDLADDGLDNDSIAVAQARRTRIPGATMETIWQGGKPLVRTLRIAKLGHDWSGSAADGTDHAPDATRLFWRFFAQHTR